MKQTRNDQTSRAFRDVIASLKGVLQSLDKLLPGVLSILLIFMCVAVFIITINSTVAHMIVLLLIIFTSILIYAQTGNYGESALGLAAGLLTFFTVDFDTGRATLFFVAWIVFSVFALVFSSIVIASKHEQIILDAVVAIDPKEQVELTKKLRQISSDFNKSILGPIQRAEVLREFAFRQLPASNLSNGLKGVVTLYEISRVDHLELAKFFADIYRVFSPKEAQFKRLVDTIYDSMRQSGVAPREYIDAFNNSRRFILTRKLPAEEVLLRIQRSLDYGVRPTDMLLHLEKEEI